MPIITKLVGHPSPVRRNLGGTNDSGYELLLAFDPERKSPETTSRIEIKFMAVWIIQDPPLCF